MHKFWSEDPLIAEDLRRAYAAMGQLVIGDSSRLAGGVRSLLENQGKMIRPALVLVAARFGTPRERPVQGAARLLRSMQVFRGNGSGYSVSEGQLPERFYRLAASIELIHMASLVHDDIVDEARMRRGQPALHTEIGPRQAVLVGDLLFASSLDVLMRDGGLHTLRGAAVAIRSLSRGAISEVENHSIPSRREYLHRIYAKTAVLFMLALDIGAREARVNRGVRGVLQRIGYNLGMGFQIIDDILDLTGDPAKLGKLRDTDLQEGVYTLPVVCAARSDLPEAAELQRMVNPVEPGGGPPYTPQQLDRIRSITIETGGVRAAQSQAMRYTERALQEMSRLPSGPQRDCLRRLVERLLERDY